MACPAPSSSWVPMSQGPPSMTTGLAPSCGAGRCLQAQQPAADGDGLDRAAKLFGSSATADGPDVLKGPVHVGVLGARNGQAGCVRAGRQDQFVIPE